MRRGRCALIGFLMCGGVLAAQQQAPLVFRASTDYVHIDAIVTDGHGKPIPDLTAADFVISDTGTPQTIADARFVNIPVQHRKLDLDQPAIAEADVETNAPPAPDSRAFVLIIDDLHLLPIVIPNVQKIMTEFVETLSPNDQVAILFAGHSNLSQNFTSDPAKLLKTIGNVKAAFGLGIGAASGVQVEEMPYDRAVVWQIRNVAEALAHSTFARRAIFFVGAFSQLDPAAQMGTAERGQVEMLQRFIDDAWDAARKADVPISTIDPRGIPDDWNAVSGVNPNLVPATADAGLNAAAPQSLRAASAGRRARWVIQQDHLAEMAINTGGQFYINRSNLIGAVDEMMADNGSFYELGYYPTPSVHDGQFHEIKVSVKRSDAHLRVTKNGYIAAAANAPAPSTMEDVLSAALGNGLNVSGISLRAAIAPMTSTKKSAQTVLTLELSYALPAGASSFSDDVQVTVLGLDPDGKVKVNSTRPWHLSGPTPSSGSLSCVVDEVVDLPAEPLTVRIGAISRLAGRAGTVQVSVDPPKASSTKLQLGGLVLGVVNQSLPLILGADTIKPVVPFQPTTLRTFNATDEVRVFGHAFWGTKDDAANETITITGGEVPITKTATVAGEKDSQGHRAGTIDGTIPLRGLAPGEYVLSVAVELSNHDHAKRVIPISIR